MINFNKARLKKLYKFKNITSLLGFDLKNNINKFRLKTI